MRVCIFILLWLASLILYATPDGAREQLKARLSPIGQVYIDSSSPSSQAKKVVPANKQQATVKERGARVYEQHCMVCHKDGIAGAPKFRVASDWESRLKGQTLEELVGHVIKGVNAMPAKGTCQECAEADLKAAIEYMVPENDE